MAWWDEGWQVFTVVYVLFAAESDQSAVIRHVAKFQ
jgi:hypothetical protein